MLPSAPSRDISTILVAEDNPSDVLLLHLAFFLAKRSDVSLRFMCDGLQAVSYLAGKERFRDREAYPLPSVVLLDLHMPRLDGFGVLAWMQANQLEIPVVILTGSDAEAEIEKAMGFAFVTGYISKQAGLGHVPLAVDRAQSLRSHSSHRPAMANRIKLSTLCP